MTGAPVNVLFTSVGRRVELVRAFRRAYADLGVDGRILAVDIDPLAPALGECDDVFMVPRTDEPHYVSTLIELCGRERIALVLPLIDPDVPVLAVHRDALDATGARTMVLPGPAAVTVADKRATADLFADLDVPAPACWTSEEAAAATDLRFPVFVKPRFGSAGVDAHRADDRAELDFWLAHVTEPIVQEHLPGPEVTSDVLCLEDGRATAVVSRRRLEVRTGEVSKGVTVHDPDIVRHCVRIAEGIEARGPITVQCLRRDDGSPAFTEVNARFGGGAPLGFAAGMRSPHWLLAQAAGMELDLPELGAYEVGLYMTRYDESLFLREEERAALASRRP
ncbi:MAG TPA: ATP-grasp domain-containing protein [Solirubrobacteraceae bacterium]|nr:ATP-grasp domain-containing protein [Solirubrobacteraceae bacterium]